ncbi:MAG: GuaB3 family IMP dehydrogenase-related protein [Elusimicrobiaceae bacterium]|jgi:IMP dehydrogenase|nr:GuaB3 family IMP dehydrogenase-related protein [Elusimicrobiaceae bacterium]MBT3954567.1 GuaB3 family IMP dehydrogenase-related protein [Elusimicrobiaceae bacterium]MBT4007875.1 GuaB3 family IMP dehydrogenase-related protein [Elusimicrobiaceae bacterium]MBT4402561.1 GuaB3 family IMP dehydrogenase-related protein [Elusimicrobiaceae bacterium]MBT4439889.1 GuaB3 family IMP dehydrogenase-related protein [Elusimicrobiaceae bacterium]
MAFYIGKDREARRTYGFDEVALAPGCLTIDPEDTDVTTNIGKYKLPIPLLASAMDGVVDTEFAIAMGKLGGLAVLNLDGINTRYDNVREITKKISDSDPETATKLVQQLYTPPIREELITQRVKEIKEAGVLCAVSCIPQNAAKFGPIAKEAGCDIFVVQSTVISVNFKSKEHEALDLKKFCKDMEIPVIAGNCVNYKAALELMETGIAGLLVGVGPGAACTSRGVLGIGVPQVTATIDCAVARDKFEKETGTRVAIITDGGMSCGGDICKCFASGADAIMFGSGFAKSKEAPGYGYHWGMATPHANLPRGTRVKVSITGTLEEILYGPSRLDDGSQNLVGALKTSMGTMGASNIREFQKAELIIAPAIKTEGKLLQKAQKIGMCK